MVPTYRIDLLILTTLLVVTRTTIHCQSPQSAAYSSAPLEVDADLQPIHSNSAWTTSSGSPVESSDSISKVSTSSPTLFASSSLSSASYSVHNLTGQSNGIDSIVLRWKLPPVASSGRATLTGYRIKYKRLRSLGRSETQFVSGPLDLFTLKGLQANTEYELRVIPQYSDARVSGSGSERIVLRTDAIPADETRLPDAPAFLNAVAKGTQVSLTFAPPLNRSVAVRGFTLNYGIGYPDVFTQLLAADDTQFVINSLEQFSEYIISLKAYNRLGNGVPVYVTAKTGRSEQQAAMQPNEQPDDDADDDDDDKEEKDEDDEKEERHDEDDEQMFDGQAFGTAIASSDMSSSTSGSSSGSSFLAGARSRGNSLHTLPAQHLDAEPPDDQLDIDHAPLPPMALQAVPLSSNRIKLTWAGDTLQSPNRYIVRYAPITIAPTSESALTASNKIALSKPNPSHFRLLNSTQPNLVVERLRPFTQYEFAVRLVLDGVRRSMWSLRATNATLEALPMGAPRRLTVVPLSPATSTASSPSASPLSTSAGASLSSSIRHTFVSSALYSNAIASAVSGDQMYGSKLRLRKLIKSPRQKLSIVNQDDHHHHSPMAAAAIYSNLDTLDPNEDSSEQTLLDMPPVESLRPKPLSAVAISWQTPRQVNGPIVSYLIAFSTNQSALNRDWTIRTVPGDHLKMWLKDLQPDTNYFFKAQVRNNKGAGPYSPVVAFRTHSRTYLFFFVLFLSAASARLVSSHRFSFCFRLHN